MTGLGMKHPPAENLAALRIALSRGNRKRRNWRLENAAKQNWLSRARGGLFAQP
jgi:hypothetical protein